MTSPLLASEILRPSHLHSRYWLSPFSIFWWQSSWRLCSRNSQQNNHNQPASSPVQCTWADCSRGPLLGGLPMRLSLPATLFARGSAMWQGNPQQLPAYSRDQVAHRSPSNRAWLLPGTDECESFTGRLKLDFSLWTQKAYRCLCYALCADSMVLLRVLQVACMKHEDNVKLVQRGEENLQALSYFSLFWCPTTFSTRLFPKCRILGQLLYTLFELPPVRHYSVKMQCGTKIV